MRYDTIPVKSASANVSFYTNNSKMPDFRVVTVFFYGCDMYGLNEHRNPRYFGERLLVVSALFV